MHVPNKSYEGYYGGAKFVKGVGVFTDIEKAKELADRYGYELVEIKDHADSKVDVKVDTKDEVKVKPEPKKRTRKKAEPKAGE